jgi:hypothetical protein
MDFEKTSEELEEDNLARPAAAAEIEEEVSTESPNELEEIEGIDEKDTQDSRHSLEVRRAIEDFAEQTRLKKELDYLFDEEFLEGGE